MTDNLIDHPAHYADSRFGVECIEFARYMTFPAGNAFKYVWRHADKGNPVQDLKKALVYLKWARDDYERFDVTPCLPHTEIMMTTMADRHLINPYSNEGNGVFRALAATILGDFDWAIQAIQAELSRLT